MIEKSLMVILFLYITSFSAIGMQYIADSYNITITNQDGQIVKSEVLDFINLEAIDTSLENVTSVGGTDDPTFFVYQSVIAAAGFAWELFLLLTGTYIFNILYLFGVPVPFIVGFVAIYGIMLIRTLIAYIRGI